MYSLELPNEIVIGKGIHYNDYFKLGVLWNLYNEEKPKIRMGKANEELTLKNPIVLDVIKSAVTGESSFLLDLVIRTNINEQIIDNKRLTIEEKIEQISRSIKQFVTV